MANLGAPQTDAALSVWGVVFVFSKEHTGDGVCPHILVRALVPLSPGSAQALTGREVTWSKMTWSGPERERVGLHSAAGRKASSQDARVRQHLASQSRERGLLV